MRRTTIKTRRPSLSARERAYWHIHKQISQGLLEAGKPISELLLARELGSSRTPIREAIGQLAAEGLLEQNRNRGAVVKRLTRSDVTDLYEVREALEIYAAGRVAERGLSGDEVASLRKLNDGIKQLKKEMQKAGTTSLSTEQMRTFLRLDMSFHAQIVTLTMNGRMQKIVGETRLLIQIFAMSRPLLDGTALERIWQKHSRIIYALEKGNSTAARKELSEHIHHSLEERLRDFDRWERASAMDKSLPAFLDTVMPPTT